MIPPFLPDGRKFGRYDESIAPAGFPTMPLRLWKPLRRDETFFSIEKASFGAIILRPAFYYFYNKISDVSLWEFAQALPSYSIFHHVLNFTRI